MSVADGDLLFRHHWGRYLNFSLGEMRSRLVASLSHSMLLTQSVTSLLGITKVIARRQTLSKQLETKCTKIFCFHTVAELLPLARFLTI